MKSVEKFQLIHPEGKALANIDKWKYDAVHTALIQVIPKDEQGVPLDGLDQRMGAALSEEDRANLGALGWYMMGVKLDMEARGEIERVPGAKPQRLRRR